MVLIGLRWILGSQRTLRLHEEHDVKYFLLSRNLFIKIVLLSAYLRLYYITS